MNTGRTRKRPARFAALAMAAFLAGGSSACGTGDAANEAAAEGWAGTIDTLPSGTIVVRNPGAPATAGGEGRDGAATAGLPPTLEVDLRLGTAAGEGPELFGQVRDIEADALGRIYVLDTQAKEIRVFGPDGSFVRTIGRGGAGPGEFEQPSGMEWSPDGLLWVEDLRNSRYSVFDTAGALVAEHPRTMDWFGFTWSGFFDDEGYLYLLEREFTPDGSEQRLVRRDSAMAVLDSFPLPEYETEVYRVVQDGLTRMAASVPFAPRQEWLVARDGTLWFGVSDAYRFYQRALDGDTLRIVEKSYEPIRVTRAEREESLDQEFYHEMAEQGADIDPDRIPEHRPAWINFTVDADGHLWVIPQTRDSTATALDAFDPEGRYLGRRTFDAAIQPFPRPVIRDDHVYAVSRDELDVQYVLRAPLGAWEALDSAE